MSVHPDSFLGSSCEDPSVDSLLVALESDNDDTMIFEHENCKCANNTYGSERASSTETESLTNSTMSSFSFGDEESPRRRSPRIRAEEMFDPPEEDPVDYDTDYSLDQKKLRRFKNQHFSNFQSWKIRMILQFTCAILAIIYLALQFPFKSLRYTWPISNSAKWRIPSSRAAFRLLNRIGSSSAQNSFTILLSGSRVDLLYQSLQRHGYCDSVSKVQILLTGNEDDLPDFLMNHDSGKVTKSGTKISTDGVLLLDENVRLTCNDLDRAFRGWKQEPSRFVGILPHTSSSSSDNKDFYSLASDDAAFVHRLFIQNRMDGASLASSAECADFALSAFVAAITKKSPILVMAQKKMQPKYIPRSCDWELSRAAGLVSQPSMRTRFIGSAL
jgi:hypothetical protein